MYITIGLFDLMAWFSTVTIEKMLVAAVLLLSAAILILAWRIKS